MCIKELEEFIKHILRALWTVYFNFKFRLFMDLKRKFNFLFFIFNVQYQKTDVIRKCYKLFQFNFLINV